MARPSPESGLHGVFVRFYKMLTKLNNANAVQAMEYISFSELLFWCTPKLPSDLLLCTKINFSGHARKTWLCVMVTAFYAPTNRSVRAGLTISKVRTMPADVVEFAASDMPRACLRGSVKPSSATF